MHILILNTHSLQAQFFRKSLRYENIGADICRPENLLKIWYGQYDLILIPSLSKDYPLLTNIIENIKHLNNTPLLILSQDGPEKNLQKTFGEVKNPLKFLSNKTSFQQITETIKKIHENRERERLNLKRLKAGELVIDLSTREVKRKNRKIHLRNKEFSLLICLMQNCGRALTRTYILENVWDRNTNLLSNTVDVHISRLRRKIDDGFTHQMIQTIPCIGYQLTTEP